MDINGMVQATLVVLTAAAWKIAGAVALWFVGRLLIGFARRVLGRVLARLRQLIRCRGSKLGK